MQGPGPVLSSWLKQVNLTPSHVERERERERENVLEEMKEEEELVYDSLTVLWVFTA